MHWLLAHFIGDFLLQNDWMSNKKKTSGFVCVIHCLCYIFPFLFTDLNAGQLVLIFIQHYTQDMSNFVVWFMKLKGSSEFINPPLGPWSIIVIDNIFHIIWISIVIKYC